MVSVVVTKDILAQYCQLQEEIKDLRVRIAADEKKLKKIEAEGEVSDTVTGTRRNGTFGTIKVTGFPVPEYSAVKVMMKKRIAKLHILEDELQEALNAVDEFINAIPQSDLRMMFRFYYLDDMMWHQVARNMNSRFPKRRTKYTADSCRMAHNRYLEKMNK